MEKINNLRKAFSPDNLTDVRWQNLRCDEMVDLGMVAADLLGRKKIILGANSRKNSHEMLEAFKEGYQKNGGEVTDYGNHCTNPMIEYLGHLYGITSVMITASHLDETWQGIKIRPHGNPEKKVKDNWKEAFKDYVESFPKKDFGDLSVTVDYFEGSAARTFPEIAAKMHIHIAEALNAGMTGDYSRFCTLSPDPTIPDNLIGIITAMRTNDSQMGVAFDGDGDRHVIILREKGEVRAIDPVLHIGISAMHYPGQKGVFVLDPFVVPAEKAIASMGHEMVKARRGRPNIIEKILDLKRQGKKVYKGMEGSYHGYDGEGFDDGIRQVLEFCEYMMKGVDIEKAKKLVGCDYTLEMRVKCRDVDIFRKSVVPALVALGETRGLKVDTTDGIWVKNSFIARASHREGAVSFVFYGKDSREEMEHVKNAVFPVYQDLADNIEEKFNVTERYMKEFYW
ncbi:MAG: hypothetical protein HXS54_17950 [Theionarchaea archaeon]|nr:hypothetical protein [Theionarchaea archaeon]